MDSQLCKAWPSKLCPVKKERLAIIGKVDQKNHADYARVKAAAEIAIQTIYGAKNDIYMLDGSGFGIPESEEDFKVTANLSEAVKA